MEQLRTEQSTFTDFPEQYTPDASVVVAYAGDSLLRRVTRNPLAVVALSLTAATGGLIGEHKALDSLKAPTVCEAPSARSIQRVEDILRQPIDPQAVAARKRRLDHVEQELVELRTLPSDNVSHTQQFLAKADDILKPYGIKITIDPNPHDNEPILPLNLAGPPAPNHADINTLDRVGRSDIQHAIKSVAKLPLSYVKYSGANEISLYRQAQNTDDLAYVILSDKERGLIHSNIAFQSDDSTLAHEFGHKIDYNECDGSTAQGNDPAYSAQNLPKIAIKIPESLEYGFTLNSKFVLDSGKLSERFQKLSQRQNTALAEQDQEQYEALRQDKSDLLSDVTETDWYGFTNVKESKATLEQAYAEPTEIMSQLDPQSPRLRRKTLILLARLWDKAPEALKDILSTASRSGDYQYANPDTYTTEIKRAQRAAKRQRGSWHKGNNGKTPGHPRYPVARN